LAFPLGTLFGQDVPEMRVRTLELAGTGATEALGCAAIAFHFGHCNDSAIFRSKFRYLPRPAPVAGRIRVWQGELLLFDRRDGHHHLPPFHSGPLFHHAVGGEIIFNALKKADANILMRHFAAPKPQGDLGFVAFAEETDQVA
jgi:hypothetical protein